MLKRIHALVKKAFHWIYRDADTGEFISEEEFERRDPRETVREKVPNKGRGK